jgi:hypothetical protein
MSDIGIIIPPWVVAGFLLLCSLAVTTPALAGLTVAWFRLRRRPAGRFLPIVKWSAIAIAPLWLAGVVFAVLWLAQTTVRDVDEARRHSTLAQAAEITGTHFPAGTSITRDESGALQFAELPDGATATRANVGWTGRIDFVEPGHAPGGAEGVISSGIPATAAIIDGISCQSGDAVHFFWDGRLMECTLAERARVSARLAGPDGVATTADFFAGRDTRSICRE